jgi:hypothetical protein
VQALPVIRFRLQPDIKIVSGWPANLFKDFAGTPLDFCV